MSNGSEKISKTKKAIKALCCGEATLPVKFFPIKKMVQYATILLIAKRGSGKSWIVRSLLYQFKDIPVGSIICPTDELTGFYGTLIPDLYIHYEYNSDFIKGVFSRQKSMIKKHEDYKNKKLSVDPRAFLVMDDCLASSKDWVKDKWMREILMNGRHSKIMFILTMQNALGVDPQLREQFDYVFLLRCNKINEQKKIYEHFAGVFPSLQVFRQVYDSLTQDFGALVINNKSNSSNLLDNIFWYKADKPNKSVLVGNKQYIKYHNDNYNNKWSSVDKIIDLNKIDKKQTLNITKKL